MWRAGGGLFQMRRASKSWSSVLQSFELWRPFWDVGVHEWQTNAVPRREARATVARVM